MENVRNAIVAMFDSWQFNYMGCYGNSWIKTPNVDRFAREGVLFENAYGNNMPTVPVRRSLMTGRYTLHEVGWGPLRLEDTTIADLCWGTGVDTAMAYNSYPLFITKNSYARSYGKAIFSRGFDNAHFKKDPLYTHYDPEQFLSDPGFLDRLRALPDGAALENMVRTELNTYLRDKQFWTDESKHTVVININEAIEILEKADREHGLHLWVDCWDPHEPWDPPSVWEEDKKCPYDPDYEGADLWCPPMSPVKDLFTEAQLHHIRMLYAEKITLTDKHFGRLLEAVKRLGYWQNTLMWMTSDHGEPLGNGEHGHGLMCKCRPWPYEELVHIPLIIKYPGCPAGKRIKEFVQDCDCAPTILDWLNIPVPANMTGKSLLPLIRGEVEKVHDFAIAGYYGFAWSIITEDWSYIHWLKQHQDSFGILDEIYPGMPQNDTVEGVEVPVKKQDVVSDAVADYEAQRSLDDNDQWTCTPAAKGELHDRDELYDRKNDPFQLNNVIDEYPEKAEELLKKLLAFMDDLMDR